MTARGETSQPGPSRSYTAPVPGLPVSLLPASCRCLEPWVDVVLDGVNHRVELACLRCGRPRGVLDAADLRALARARRR